MACGLIGAGLKRSLADEKAQPPSGLASFATIKYFALLDRDFTEAAGELTPTLKKKRRVIAQHFHDQIEDMYSSHKR